jgi:hypothetical protein
MFEIKRPNVYKVLFHPIINFQCEMATADQTDLTATVHTEVSVKNESAEGSHSVHLLAEQTTDVCTSTEEERRRTFSSVFKRCIPNRSTLGGRLLYMLLLVTLIILLELTPINEYAIVKQIKRDLEALLGNSTLASDEQ